MGVEEVGVGAPEGAHGQGAQRGDVERGEPPAHRRELPTQGGTRVHAEEVELEDGDVARVGVGILPCEGGDLSDGGQAGHGSLQRVTDRSLHVTT